jgi:hypothetical protein
MRHTSVLSQSEYASLSEVGTGFLHDAIPPEDAARLVGLGFVYKLLGDIRITTAGRLRVENGF